MKWEYFLKKWWTQKKLFDDAEKSHKKFLECMTETTMFATFVTDNYMAMTGHHPEKDYIRFFDECIVQKHNQKLSRDRRTETPFLKYKVERIPIRAMPPNNNLTPSQRNQAPFEYERFPKWDANLFGKIRIEAPRAPKDETFWEPPPPSATTSNSENSSEKKKKKHGKRSSQKHL